MRKNLKEARQAAGFTQQQMADFKIEFDSADAMQERQQKIILVRGQEIPTYQFVFEQAVLMNRRMNRITVLAWAAVLMAVSMLLLK